MGSQDRQPSIRFGDQSLPAHQVWARTKLLYGVNEFLARFNDQMPEFVTERTIALVPEVRRRLKAIEVAMPRRFEPSRTMIRNTRATLRQMSVEEALEQFNAEHEQHLSMQDFIEVVGSKTYCAALRQEAREWELNKILPSQTAEIWNEQNRPAPGDPGVWDANKIEHLLSGGYT